MSRTQKNLLLALHKWACDRRQDENFTTEAFASLLDHLLRNDQVIAARILTLLGCPTCDVELSTQVRHGDSQPDIKIATANIRICIEVKVDAPIDWNQIARHRAALNKESADFKLLVLVTKGFPNQSIPEAIHVDRFVRWYEIANTIRNGLSEMSTVAEFLAQEFLEFLEARGMTIKQVTRELITKREAVSSFANLMEMLHQALLDSGFKKGHVHEHLIDGGGFYFGRESDWGPYWCGINYENPDTVHFHVYELQDSAITRAQAKGWELVEEGRKRTKVCRKGLHLTDNFFHGPALDQRDCLKGFVERCCDEIQRVKAGTAA